MPTASPKTANRLGVLPCDTLHKLRKCTNFQERRVASKNNENKKREKARPGVLNFYWRGLETWYFFIFLRKGLSIEVRLT